MPLGQGQEGQEHPFATSGWQCVQVDYLGRVPGSPGSLPAARPVKGRSAALFSSTHSPALRAICLLLAPPRHRRGASRWSSPRRARCAWPLGCGVCGEESGESGERRKTFELFEVEETFGRPGEAPFTLRGRGPVLCLLLIAGRGPRAGKVHSEPWLNMFGVTGRMRVLGFSMVQVEAGGLCRGIRGFRQSWNLARMCLRESFSTGNLRTRPLLSFELWVVPANTCFELHDVVVDAAGVAAAVEQTKCRNAAATFAQTSIALAPCNALQLAHYRGLRVCAPADSSNCNRGRLGATVDASHVSTPPLLGTKQVLALRISAGTERLVQSRGRVRHQIIRVK